ncbi:hypothetical protein N7535_009320 [Penicillium sp. DV-2018c]|nr:hypothetical protein N7461_002771 [Penicillium sp. DV-2018c]KAJ5561123.1 hypothetical protein N7535_009320 [Penicillium sp. DV-2018c]
MPKNPKFEYEAKQPAFLQKLRGQYGDNTGRLERPALRPTRLKVNRDDDEDEPTYVDEESNEVISKEQYKALVGESGSKEEGEDATSAKDPSTAREDNPAAAVGPTKQSNLTEVGGQRKRKQVKVVGEDKADAEEVQPKSASKKSKKSKKIKLSFDED